VARCRHRRRAARLPEGAEIDVSFFSLFRFFLTWWGALILGALDSSLFFFVPFGTDAVVVYLCARRPSLFWLYPLLTTAGSIAGASVLSSTTRADGFVIVGDDSEGFPAGAEVEVWLYA